MLLPTPAPSRAPVNVHSVYLLASALSSWQVLANWTLVQWARSDRCGPAIGMCWPAVRDEKTTVLGHIESQWLDTHVDHHGSFYWVGSMMLSMIIGCSLRSTDDAKVMLTTNYRNICSACLSLMVVIYKIKWKEWWHNYAALLPSSSVSGVMVAALFLVPCEVCFLRGL